MKKFQALTICILILIPLVVGECTCERASDDGEENRKSESLKYKIGAIIAILVASATGVCIPLFGNIFPALQPEKNLFFIIKAFAAGVILATALIHILPDAFENLTSPCLEENPWGNFPFTGFVTMVSAIGTLMVDTVATSYFTRTHTMNAQTQPDSNNNNNNDNSREGDEENNIEKMVAQHDADHHHHLHMHAHASDDHSHGSFKSLELIRHRVITQVLELGIVVHSVIIGITLGASQSPKTIKPLMAALVFHQFFEGMGLGGCISQAKFKLRAIVIMGLFFSLTTPVGIAIGAGISSRYDENSPKALIIQGILDAASAGILIYMSLVDLLAADFLNPKMQSNGKLQLGANVSLLLGAACMSVLAKWA